MQEPPALFELRGCHCGGVALGGAVSPSPEPLCLLWLIELSEGGAELLLLDWGNGVRVAAGGASLIEVRRWQRVAALPRTNE